MNEQYVNALLQAVTRQRDQALNAAAQLEAQMEVARMEIAELKAKLEQPSQGTE